MTTMTMPASAQRSLRNCRQKISHGERPTTSFGATIGVSRCCGLRRVDEFFCCEVALDVPWCFHTRARMLGVSPPASAIQRGMLRQETATCINVGLRHASGPRAGARYRYPGAGPAPRPRTHARRTTVDPSDCDPAAAHQQRDGIGRVRLPDARGGVVAGDRHDRGREVQERRTSEKNARVDRRDDVALVLGAAVVRRDIGSFDVDVERVDIRRARPRPAAPIPRTRRRRHPIATSMPRRGAATGCIPSTSAMPRSTGISTKQPHSGPKRSAMRCSTGR